MDSKWDDRSKKQRKQYLESVKGLYGDEVPKPATKIALTCKRGTRAKFDAKRTEYYAQAALVKWARLMGLPIFSIPNHGKRSRIGGYLENNMGLTAGVSDLFLMVSNSSCNGFFLEMKAEGKIPSISQYAFMELARNQGYKAEYYDNWEKAKIAIEEYLKA